MTEQAQAMGGLAIFCLISIGSGIVFHVREQRFGRATFRASATTVVLTQLIIQGLNYSTRGQIDPLFASVGLVVTAVVGTLLVTVVGALVRAI
jgi:hypothetical protein